VIQIHKLRYVCSERKDTRVQIIRGSCYFRQNTMQVQVGHMNALEGLRKQLIQIMSLPYQLAVAIQIMKKWENKRKLSCVLLQYWTCWILPRSYWYYLIRALLHVSVTRSKYHQVDCLFTLLDEHEDHSSICKRQQNVRTSDVLMKVEIWHQDHNEQYWWNGYRYQEVSYMATNSQPQWTTWDAR